MPTKRDCVWATVWVVTVLSVYFAASTFFGRKAYNPPLKPAAEEPIHAVRLAPPSADPQRMSAPMPPSPTMFREEFDRLNNHPQAQGWTPSGFETPGDARSIQAKEVEWLKSRLLKASSRASNRPASTAQTSLQRDLARFVARIPYTIETHGWSLPKATLAANRGDCQDHALLLAEMLCEAGIDEVAVCRGVPADYVSGQPGHAWVRTRIDQVAYVIESTNGTVYRVSSGGPLDSFETIFTVWNKE